MSTRPSPARLIREFLTRYPRHVVTLLVVLVLEGIVATVAVLALVPLADFLLDPELRSPTRITRVLIDLLGRDGNESMFGEFALILIAANFFKGVLDIATRHAVLRIKYAVSRELARDALSTFFKARWEFFSGVDHGRLLNTLNRELTTIADTLGHLATQLANLVQLAIYLVVPFWLSPGMTLTAFGLAALLGSPLLLLHKTSYRMGRRGTETANVMIGVLNEAIGASRLVLGFGRQKQSVDRFVHAFDVHTRATLHYQTLSAAAVAIVQPLGLVSVLLAVGLGLQRGIPLAEMAALLWSLLRAIPLLGSLMSTNVTIRSFLPAYDQLAKLRDEAHAFREVEGAHEFQALREGVSLRHVDFTYPGRSGTLHDVSIDIRKGHTTALVGESGSGKSTIADLVMALQVPVRGDVLLDGRPMGEWRQNSFRERVGYVPQEPILFHASIRDNLLWSCDTATDDDLWHACAMANAASFVRELPQGLDTIVGDRGVRLSGGQRQRIALARALLRKPELLILDEATSALDSESEQLIQRAINELSRDSTILVIAHRLSTISRADRVYVLDAGRVVEEGSYAELARKPNGVLASMIAVQRHEEPRTAAAG